MCLFELTICFENRFEEVHALKINKYEDLNEETESSKFILSLITLEVGGRGPYNPACLNNLRAHITTTESMESHAK